jgi:hypothetical protein
LKRSLKSGRTSLASPTIALAAALCALFSFSLPARAAVTAWLDYTDFDARMSELAAVATVTPYTLEEQAQIRAIILSGLQNIYSGFDVSFTETRPVSGDYERLVWGLPTSEANLLGLADRIDFRNQHGNDVSRIYTANFARYVNEFDGTDQRKEQLTQLSHALLGTAAHELAHNFGIEHCDCYACQGVSPDNYGNTGGLQNSHIIATGGTGLNEAGRETMRTFSSWERVKLAYGKGLLAGTPPVLAEQALVHDSLGTAQTISLTDIPIADASSALITGEISEVNEMDYFSFSLLAGQTFTARVHSETMAHIGNPVNSFMSFFAPSGATLFADDDIEYNRNVFNSGLATDLYSRDTFFVNIPITETGIYSLAVSGVGGDTGGYELLLATTPVVVPEASAGWLSCSGLVLGATVFWRRRAWRHL